jgi:translation initiation factor IF-2
VKEKKINRKKKTKKNIIKKYIFEPKHTIQDLARILELSNSFLIQKLIELGIKTNINENIDEEKVKLLGKVLKIKIIFNNSNKKKEQKIKKIINNENKKIKKNIVKRSPIVIIMGHVDHGKTTLLDTIRKTHITDSEFGGITQHIGAYEIIHNKEKITFIDSPGHEAFFQMRSRGAKITDICLLVVAADDGIKEQTIESIKHAQESKVDIIVVINKIDKKNIQKENIMSELSKMNLVPEQWGGKTPYIEISALKKKGINELLDMILLMRDIQDTKTNLNEKPQGVILEAELDKKKGPIATLISFQGILKIGDIIVIGENYSKIRSIESDLKNKIIKAFPSQPVVISGLSKVPEAGDNFIICENIKKAKKIVEERKKISHSNQILKEKENQKEENILFSIEQEEKKFLNIILKVDKKGSIEAIVKSLKKLNLENIEIKFIKTSIGIITVNDIQLAKTFQAIIIGFNTEITNKIIKTAKNMKVEVINYNILYKMIEDIENKLKQLIEPTFEEKLTGKAEIQKIFNISSIGSIAGCYVTQGIIFNNTLAKVIRENKIIFECKIISLKHLKNNIKEAKQGHECGILLENFNDFQIKDIIEAYKKEKVIK